jgi:hypothetical protein
MLRDFSFAVKLHEIKVLGTKDQASKYAVSNRTPPPQSL